MAQRFPITINDDGTVRWHGVDTGKTKVLAMDGKEKLIVLHIGGHTFWSGRSRQYAKARIEVHRYTEGPSTRKIFLTELFGIMSWEPYPLPGKKWRPRQ